jgi:hypothetical protein
MNKDNSGKDVEIPMQNRVDSTTKKRAKELLGLNLRDDTVAERGLGNGKHMLDNGVGVLPEVSPDYERLTSPGKRTKLV